MRTHLLAFVFACVLFLWLATACGGIGLLVAGGIKSWVIHIEKDALWLGFACALCSQELHMANAAKY